MKQFFLIAAALAISTPALASKARMSAFQTSQAANNSPHIKDVQTAFDNPSDILLIPDYATFEMGATSTSAVTADAEGGFAMTAGDAKWGFYVGRKSQFTTAMRTILGFQGQENPIEIQYAKNADLKWGVALNYSQSEQKTSALPRKQQAAGVRFGVNANNYDAFLILGLGATGTGNAGANASLNLTALDSTLTGGLVAGVAGGAMTADPNSTYKGLAGAKFGGNYKMDSLNYFGEYYMDGAEYNSDVAGNAGLKGAKINQSQATLGVLERNKLEAGEWYYGVALRSFMYKRDSMASAALKLKVDTLSMPFFVGLESKVNDWMVARGSVTQNILFGERKITTDATATTVLNGEKDSVPTNTTVAAGLGFLMGKLTLDTTLAGATTGNVNQTTLFANAGLTYNF
jgi:hypothetical protein